MKPQSEDYESGNHEDIAYRNDLADAIAIFVSRPNTGKATDELIQYMGDVTATLEDENTLVPPLDREVAVHPYEIPPAAGAWSEIAVLLWEHGRPLLENVSMIAGAAEGIRQVTKLATKWNVRLIAQRAERIRQTGAPISLPQTDPNQMYFLSQGAICVLVVADFVQRYGYQEDLTLVAFPRGLQGYNDPAHPNASITYLIECRWDGNQTLIYVVDSRANVIEHFEIRDGQSRPLSTPDLLHHDEFFLGQEVGEHGLEISVGSK